MGPSPHVPAASSGVASLDERSRVSSIDSVAFAIFIGYIVLAFTTAFPYQFALPKLLGLYVYTAFAAVRWGLGQLRGGVQRLPRLLTLTTIALACWWITTTLTARHWNTALFGMRGRNNGLATMLAELALFLLSRRRECRHARSSGRSERSASP